jgi:methoxymalonate biosynthesis protein
VPGGAHLAADFRPTDRNRMMDIAYRFAGFTGDACECVAGLDPLDDDRVERLHLLPTARDGATTMTVSSPELAADLARRLDSATR